MSTPLFDFYDYTIHHTGRATIIVNLISLGLGILTVISLIITGAMANSGAFNPDEYDDDEMKAAVEELDSMAGAYGSIWVAVGLSIARLFFNALGAWGAYKYLLWPVGASLVIYAVECVFAVVTLNLVGVLVSGCFAYPHVYLILEMRNGIMTKENYETEKFSCCCV